MKSLVFAVNLPRIGLTKALSMVGFRKVYYGDLSALTYCEMDEPKLSGDQWVKVRSRMCGICGSDLHLITLKIDPRVSLAALPNHVPKGAPKYLGHEVVGEVVETGADVADLKTGDRVALATGIGCAAMGISPPCHFCGLGNVALCQKKSEAKPPVNRGGGWSEYFTAHESQLYKVLDSLSDREAALLEPSACSLRAVFRRIPRKGENILVVGAGPIGINAVQVARFMAPKCTISIVAKYPYQGEIARKYGVDHVIYSRAGDTYERVATLTGGKLYKGKFGNKTIVGGFDLIYDCIGSPRTLHTNLRWIRTQGTIVVVGAHLKLGAFDYSPLWNQEISLIGSEAHGMEEYNGKKIPTFELTAQLIAQKKLNVEPLITHTFRLSDYKKAFEILLYKAESEAIKGAFTF